MRALALLLILLAAADATDATAQTSSPEPEARRLRWRLKAGARFEITTRLEQTQTMRIGAAPEMRMQLVHQIRTDRRVERVGGDGVAHLRERIRRIVTRIASGERVTLVDTDEPAPADANAADIHARLQRMTSRALTSRLTSRGEPHRIALPPGLSAESGKPFAAMLRHATLPFPARALAPGDTWNSEYTIDLGRYRMTYKVQYELVGRSGGQTEIRSRTRVEPAANDGGPRVTIREQTGSGTLWFDDAGGYLARVESKARLVLSADAGAQSVGQTINQTMRFRCQPHGAASKE